jgi:hypothetical protein
MTGAQLVGLGVRLFAIWLVVYVLRYIPGVWRFSASAASVGTESTNAVIVAVTIAILALAAGLWFFPLTVASKLLPPTAKTDQAHIPIEQVQSVGFSLLGLWVLTSAVPDSFYWVFMTYQSSRPNSILELGSSDYAYVVTTAVELVLGVWLLLGARGLVGLLRWARMAGT